MVGTEMISGMEELVNHIRELEAEIKKLRASAAEEENRYQDCNESWKAHYYAEKEKLQQENEKLKKRIEEDHKAVPTFLIQDMYHDTKEENKKLKEERDFFQLEFHKTLQHQADDTEHYEKENKKLKEEIAHKNKLFGEWCEENKKLKEENEKLFHKADNWELKYHTLRDQLNLSSESDESDEESDDVIETEPESDKP